MGPRLSRRVKFGAVRFKFSGFCIGMSVDIPALRIGTIFDNFFGQIA